MKSSDPLLLADGNLHCGMYPAGKVAISWHLDTPGFPGVTILLASSVRTLVYCAVKYSRPLDLKSSSNVSLPFAWITGPATDPSSLKFLYTHSDFSPVPMFKVSMKSREIIWVWRFKYASSKEAWPLSAPHIKKSLQFAFSAGNLAAQKASKQACLGRQITCLWNFTEFHLTVVSMTFF